MHFNLLHILMQNSFHANVELRQSLSLYTPTMILSTVIMNVQQIK